jgi:signal transduction histidine kinase
MGATLSGSEHLVTLLMRDIPARVWIKDAEGRYVFVNPRLISELGIDREKWIGTTDEELFPTVGHVYRRKDQQVLASGEYLASTDQLDREKYSFVLRFPLDIEGERHVAGIGVETTEQMSALIGVIRLRDELFRSERLRSIGEVASGLAHDLRNTLQAATLRLRILRAKADEALIPEVDALARSIESANERVHGLQEYVNAKPQEELELIDLPSVIDGAIEMVSILIEKTPTDQGGVINLEYDRSTSLPKVPGFHNQLKHVISNLLINARDAMPHGGRLLIEARETQVGVEVAISDEGEGIPDEIIGKIFEPFFTTKELGNGLGLSMARDVMKRLGGQIFASNRLPRGASFTLKFPVAKAPEA